jgi:hypothetical protein
VERDARKRFDERVDASLEYLDTSLDLLRLSPGSEALDALTPSETSSRASKSALIGPLGVLIVLLLQVLFAALAIAINVIEGGRSLRIRGEVLGFGWIAVVGLVLFAAVLELLTRRSRQWREANFPKVLSSFGPSSHIPSVRISGRADQVRRILIRQVRRTWIDGVLNRSLARVVRIRLSLIERSDLVAHPWGELLSEGGEPNRQLPPDISIDQVADRYGSRFLILGGPGTGKTTFLLELTSILLNRAEQNSSEPIPVVFHLSSWPVEETPLAEWLVEELNLRYGVARRQAIHLVENDGLAVLLDGLDEVSADRRAGCVRSINAFAKEHGQLPLVVCSRADDYEDLSVQLRLSGAIELQPLSREVVERWLSSGGRALSGLRAALHDDERLQDFLTTPLSLDIAV